MGYISQRQCTDCGEVWIYDTEGFYLTSDDRIEEHPFLSISYCIERRSVAWGWINKLYCRKCDNDIKIYLLSEVKTEYSSRDPNMTIDEYKHQPNAIFGTSDEFKDGTKINCQKCKKELELHIDEINCLDDVFILNCTTYQTRCEECDEKYMVYAIRPPRRDYTQEEALQKIEKLKDKDILLYSSEEFETISEIECPCCGETVLRYDGDTCPKCEGKLEEIGFELYD